MRGQRWSYKEANSGQLIFATGDGFKIELLKLILHFPEDIQIDLYFE
jgi:hypothetical protein